MDPGQCCIVGGYHCCAVDRHFFFLQDCGYVLYVSRGPGSSVVIATDYRLDGLGSNPGGDEIFRLSRPDLGPTQPPVKWLPGLSRG